MCDSVIPDRQQEQDNLHRTIVPFDLTFSLLSLRDIIEENYYTAFQLTLLSLYKLFVHFSDVPTNISELEILSSPTTGASLDQMKSVLL